MKKRLLYWIIVMIVCMPFISYAKTAQEPKIIIKPNKPGPGDIMIVTVKGTQGPVEGTFEGRKVYFYPAPASLKAMVGVDLLTEPGIYKLDVTSNGKRLSREIIVVKKKFEVQKLTLPKDLVELSPENEARAEREQKKMAEIWPNESDRSWAGNFMNPRQGEISTKFGLRRIINDIPKNPHSGVDVAAELGKEVYAPNDGKVVLVDDHFFSGNSLVLDHGQGIYTMFFHLSKILVTGGQAVKKGDVIALVGSTGRSTGPHLHWGARMQGARVDPLQLIKLKLE